jgi:hypothetical protein
VPRPYLTVAVALCASGPTAAVPLIPFTDAETFARRATEVVVADCRDPDVLGGPKDDGLTLVGVDVVRTLKGDRKAGPARLATIGQPMEKGKRYLMVSFGGSALGSDFVANADLAVVEVPAGFDLKSLDGKPVADQVRTILAARRAEVAARVRRLEAERAALDAAVAAADGWVGEYARFGGWDGPGRGPRVTITKGADGYHLNLKGYETYPFVEQRPGALRSKALGTITQGTARLEGQEPFGVLRAELCYEGFYLFGGPAPAADRK